MSDLILALVWTVATMASYNYGHLRGMRAEYEKPGTYVGRKS